jgi:hypothetical protein
MTEEKLGYTIKGAAEAYSVSQDVIRAHIEKGNLIARYPSSRPVIAAAELEEWFQSLPSERPAA